MSKKERFYLIYLSITVIIALIGTIAAFLTFNQITEREHLIGHLEIEIEIFFLEDDGSLNGIKHTENLDFVDLTKDENGFTKFGITKVNISDVEDIKFIRNFRVNIHIKSSIDTYFRVAPYEQLTLTYVIGEVTREVATTQRRFVDFNYDPNSGFENNRIVDGFYYYKDSVKRISENEPLVIEFIGEFSSTADFNIYDPKYSLQMGFIVEAVQALDGPLNVWGLASPPWGGEW